MSDRSIDQVVTECARYWRDTGVPGDASRKCATN